VDNDIIANVVEYIWIPMVAAIIATWRRVSGLDTRTLLINQHDEHELTRRKEDRETHARDRREALSTIEKHHDLIMKKLDSLEVRIKNGH
jgi:hypothetical protein